MSLRLMMVCVLSVGVVTHAQSPAPKPAPAPKTAVQPATPRPAPTPAAKPATPRTTASKPAAPPRVPSTAALTDEQKTVYALGLLLQRSIRSFDLSTAEIDILRRAIVDGTAGTPALELEEWGPKVQPFAEVRGLRAVAREKAAGATYLAKAAAEAGAVKTASGLVYREIAAGTGPSPTSADTVRVGYRGTLISGIVFDSSYERNEPAEFPLAGVIPCWTEGVQRMRVGGKARLVCPSDLAYGDTGAPATIPGGAALVFEVELLGVLPRPGAASPN